MELAFEVAAICLVGCVMALLLKGTSPALALGISTAAAIAVLLLCLTQLEGLGTVIGGLLAVSGLEEELFAPLFKAVAIALLCHLGAQLCRDAGEGAMAALVELGAVAGILIVSVPLFTMVLDFLEGLV